MVNWTEQMDTKLLLAVIVTSDVKPNWSAIAEYMGPELTYKAVQHRFGRIKERAKAIWPALGPSASGVASTDGVGDGASETATAGTPEKRKRGRPRKNTASTASVSASTAAPPADADADADGDGDGEEGESPTKMQKSARGRPKAAVAVKTEEETDPVIKHEDETEDEPMIGSE